MTVSANTSPSRLRKEIQLSEQFRRRSEGSEPAPIRSSASRCASFHTTSVLKCRYSRCGRVATATASEGLAFKNCHNCSYTYCSRACRRAHWEKHRKTCLFSRIGSLCRQVIAAIKEKPETLLHVSNLARRGYLSHGLGAVKCFFPCPEDAEKFLSGGLECLGEPTYVRWADLLPSEMGPQLYTELVKMCKNYKPDSKLIVYVSVCVVSEAPTVGAVKWERQLVSRCAKMRLSKDVVIPEKEVENPETIVLTSSVMKDNSEREIRQAILSNIQHILLQKGISLKRQYPDIYHQLCLYVEGNCDKFTPVTIYPHDSETGKTFMCIIMPEADPDSLEQVITAGVQIRTIDVLQN